jgi:hypothetical protein
MASRVSKRYVDPHPEDRAPLDPAYAAAMAKVWKDAEIQLTASCFCQARNSRAGKD